jgi:hypothetical protein
VRKQWSFDEAENIPDYFFQSGEAAKALHNVCIHSLDSQCNVQCIQNPENVMP